MHRLRKMRSLTRLAGASAAVLLGLSSVALSTGEASAAPAATLVGSAPASAHGPGTVTFSYAITLPSDVDAAVFSTRQAAALPADPTSVMVDGVAVPPAQISEPSTIDIAVHAGPTPADGLTAGPHTVTFTAPVSNLASVAASSTATLSWTAAGTPDAVTSDPVVVELNAPDLAVTLTPGSGEDQVGFLGTGRDIDVAVDVENDGYGAPNSTLTIGLPVGMTLGRDGVTRDTDDSALTCRPGAGSTITCDLGPVGRGVVDPTLVIDLVTMPHPPVGTTVPVTFSVAPNAGEGVDSNPADDQTSVRVLYTGSAALSTTITPASSKVALGQTTKVRLTIHNAGPQTAPETLAFAVVIGSQFEVTGFTGKSLPIDPNPGSASAAALRRAHLLTAPTLSPAAGLPLASTAEGTELLWLVGDIPDGGSVSAVVSLKAQKLGQAQLGLLAISGAGDPNCPDFNCDPTMVSVQVVKAAPAPTSSAPAPAGSGTAGLANTGASSRPAAFGGLFLLAGFAMLYAGRRPTRRRH